MGKTLTPAYIDISVECMHCGKVLYTGVYSADTVAKLKRRIKRDGWVHHPMEGTLCPSCASKDEKK